MTKKQVAPLASGEPPQSLMQLVPDHFDLFRWMVRRKQFTCAFLWLYHIAGCACKAACRLTTPAICDNVRIHVHNVVATLVTVSIHLHYCLRGIAGIVRDVQNARTGLQKHLAMIS